MTLQDWVKEGYRSYFFDKNVKIPTYREEDDAFMAGFSKACMHCSPNKKTQAILRSYRNKNKCQHDDLIVYDPDSKKDRCFKCGVLFD